MIASWKHHASVMKASCKMLEDAWRCLKMLKDTWRHLKTLEDAWDALRCLKTLEEAWWCLMMHDDISIMHLIKRHHPCNQEASYMESTSIIHGFNKHHVINKRQEWYSIIDKIASLIATFKHYALVSLIYHMIYQISHLIASCQKYLHSSAWQVFE